MYLWVSCLDHSERRLPGRRAHAGWTDGVCTTQVHTQGSRWEELWTRFGGSPRLVGTIHAFARAHFERNGRLAQNGVGKGEPPQSTPLSPLFAQDPVLAALVRTTPGTQVAEKHHIVTWAGGQAFRPCLDPTRSCARPASSDMEGGNVASRVVPAQQVGLRSIHSVPSAPWILARYRLALQFASASCDATVCVTRCRSSLFFFASCGRKHTRQQLQT